MISRTFLIACILVLLGPRFARSDEPQTAWKPQQTPVVSLTNVGVAKITGDASNLVVSLLLPKMVTETRVRRVTVYVPETRTRTVTLADGTSREQTYVVQVPVAREEAYTVEVPGGMERQDSALRDTRVWTLDGVLLTADEVQTRLANPAHVFLLDQPFAKASQGVDPFYRAVLNPNTLCVFLAGPAALAPIFKILANFATGSIVQRDP